MSFFFKWLRPERPTGVSLHPVRKLELAEPFESVFARSIEGIERILGGIVRESDAQRGTIDATFGLVNSERLSVTLERMENDRTRAIVESRRTLTPSPAVRSDYVDALANYLEARSP
jgi:hypothetical protein